MDGTDQDDLKFDVVEPGSGPHHGVAHTGTRITATWNDKNDVWFIHRDITDRTEHNPLTVGLGSRLRAAEFRSYSDWDVWVFMSNGGLVYLSARLAERTI